MMKDQEMLLYNSLSGLYLLDKADTHTVVSDLMGLQAQFANHKVQIGAGITSGQGAGADPDKGLQAAEESRVQLANEIRGADILLNEIGRGNNTRDGLKAACARAGMGEELLHRTFYGWGGLIREMVTRGLIVCGAGTRKEYFIPNAIIWKDRDEARRAFLRRYFEHYGPATLSDCRYFFSNWKKADMDPLLHELVPELICTVIEGKKYYSLHEPVTDASLPECVLVPGFDQLVLGYRDRDRMIDRRFLKELTNISGIVSPSILIRGRIRARWKLTGTEVQVVFFDKHLKKDEATVRRKVREVFGKQVKQVVFINA